MLSRYIELLPNRQNTRKLLSKADSKSPKRRLAYRKLLPKSVIAGACFTAEGKAPLVFIDRNVMMNSEVFQNTVLKGVLLPWVTSHFGQRPFTLQQDWAPSHGSKSTKSVLDAHFPGYWGKDMWPVSSPDLHPLDFYLALLNTWDDIDDNYLRRTVDSVPDRLKACIEAKGFNFEHVLK
uniref:DDE_3 domain-containing protein n=1 Tax=Caenorhabditis japonica TaxID=281687 RepID=A0A8R1HLT9_CAEJA